MSKTYIGFAEAFDLALGCIGPLEAETRLLADSLAAVAAEDVWALADAPSASSSLKDGYAIRAADVAQASPDTPARLTLSGFAAAGTVARTRLEPKAAVRILTGGRIPQGADAVVAEEFTRREDDDIIVDKALASGRNILPRGTDVAAGEKIVATGERLTPGRLGLLAAAGHSQVRVYRKTRVAIIATGDEIRLPGTPLEAGQLYASNAVTLEAWCHRLNCGSTVAIAPDRREAIRTSIAAAVESADAVLTSGGAWSGDRDLVQNALEDLGWQKVFHRVRLGPGKGTGLGLVGRSPVFMLPGGPPSNLAGFLKLALPALLKMGGHAVCGLPRQYVRLQDEVSGPAHWTQAVFGGMQTDSGGRWLFQPDRQVSRLKALGRARALLTIPEGVEIMAAGSPAEVEWLE